jgi:hypothetical protein
MRYEKNKKNNRVTLLGSFSDLPKHLEKMASLEADL